MISCFHKQWLWGYYKLIMAVFFYCDGYERPTTLYLLFLPLLAGSKDYKNNVLQFIITIKNCVSRCVKIFFFPQLLKDKFDMHLFSCLLKCLMFFHVLFADLCSVSIATRCSIGIFFLFIFFMTFK